LRRVTQRDGVPGERLAPGARPGHDDLIRKVDAITGAPCSCCSRPLCGHEALASVVFRLAPAARCLRCLAAGLDTDVEGLLSDLRARMARRSCQRAAWERASSLEGPDCCWSGARTRSIPEAGLPLEAKTA
jgi:hypothetical protein